MDAPLPLLLIGGWLGAGKTTLVNHGLRHAAGRRVAVLVNDFGDVDIDAALIEGAEAGVLALAGGCLCCSFGDDLLGTLRALRVREPRPEVVWIELSGVALPGAVARTARLAEGVTLVGTLVVADAAQVQRQAADAYVGDTVRAQLGAADWLLANKADALDADALAATTAWLGTCAPRARVWAGGPADVPLALLLDRVEPAPRERRGAFAPRPLHAAAARFESRSVVLPDGTDLEALGRALAAPGSGLLRAKGFARDGAGRTRLLQVAGQRWAVTAHGRDQPPRLVLIGRRGTLERVLADIGLADRAGAGAAAAGHEPPAGPPSADADL